MNATTLDPEKTEVYWDVVTDILSQAITGELVGMSNFATLTGTIDDVHEKMECVEHSNCERNHAEGFLHLAKKYKLPVNINLEGYYWKNVRESFNRWANKPDFIGCIIMQEVMLECFAVSMYKDVGTALEDHEIGQLFLSISKEEEEHIEHSIDLLKAELDKDYAGFIQKVEDIHNDCMTILAEWSATVDLKGHCGVCRGECMKNSLYAAGLDIKGLRGNSINLYLKTLDRIGIPGIKSIEWITQLPI
ncbi:MAG: long-chain fatty aldehyde decarbonylase [Ginsengibacter sp.]